MPDSKKMRLWPALLILALDATVLVWIWSFQDVMRQERVVNTMLSQLLAALLLLSWLLFFSRLRWRTRFAALGVVAFAIAAFVGLFRFKEFSGDLAPVFEWRWRSQAPGVAATAEESFLDRPQSNAPVPTVYSYPQFLGPQRDCKLTGIALERDWQAHPPRLVWRQPIGEGWSAFAVSGNLAVTQEQAGEEELVVCYELTTGKVIWRHADETRYETALGGIGPRATPTIDGARVYTMGATGILNCLSLDSGERLWSKNVLQENQAAANPWGQSCSPLVVDSLVIVSAGGADRALVAYHKDTGEVVWAAGNDQPRYSSPLIARLAGVRQVVIFNEGHVVAHDPLGGTILWQFPWPKDTEEVAQPVVLPNDRILITSGYGIGSKLIQITATNGTLSATQLWESNRMKAKFTNVVYLDGYIYGLDDGILACIDAADGKRKWKRGRYGHGQLLLVDDLLLIQAESGEIALVEANPEQFNELGRFPAIKGKTWNNPVLVGPYLLVRNSQEAACYKLVLRTAANLSEKG